MTGGDDDGGKVHDLTIEILRSIRDEIHTGFATTNQRLESVEARLGNVEDRLIGLEDRVDQTNERLEQVVGGLNQANGRLDLHSQALAKLVGEVSTLNTRFDNFLTGSHREEHNELRTRIEKLEERLDKAG